MIVWILSLKSDISNISDINFELKKENDSLVNRIDFLTKKPELKKEPVLEIKPKKIFKRSTKDTIRVKPVVIPEVKPVIVDSIVL